MNPTTEAKAVQFALANLPSLPQGALIDRENAITWSKAVWAREPQRFVWHFRRLRGIGGSEMGPVVSWFRNEYHPFTQAADIVRGKLMINPPGEPSGDTRRGVATEDMNRDLFREYMAKEHGAVPADDVLDAVHNVISTRNPWQVGNPDDAFWMPMEGMSPGVRSSAALGTLVMVDYKHPRQDAFLDYVIFGKPFDYVVQLHHYSMLAQDAGLDPKRLMLVSMNSDEWRPIPSELSFDNDLCDEISRAGNALWDDYVLKGLVPESLEKPCLDPKRMPQDIVELARQAARALAMANVGYQAAREFSKVISSRINERFFSGNASISFDHVDILCDGEVDEKRLASRLALWGEDIADYRAGGKYDEVAMERKLRALGVDTSQYVKFPKFDVTKLRQRLVAGGEDVSRYIRETAQVKLTPLRKGPRADRFFDVKNEAAAALQSFVDAGATLNATAANDGITGADDQRVTRTARAGP